MPQLAANIKRYRRKFMFSQDELAQVMETSKWSIGQWEKGRHRPQPKKIRDLAAIFNVPVEKLCNEVPTTAPETDE